MIKKTSSSISTLLSASPPFRALNVTFCTLTNFDRATVKERNTEVCPNKDTAKQPGETTPRRQVFSAIRSDTCLLKGEDPQPFFLSC